MLQRSAAFHAAGAAYPGDDIESLYTAYICSNDEVMNGTGYMSLRIDAELKDAFMAAAKSWTVMALS